MTTDLQICPEGTIVLTTDRLFLGCHFAQRWQFIRLGCGAFYVREHVDQNRFTEEERIVYERALEHTKLSVPLVDLFLEQPELGPLWPALEHAQTWAVLQDKEEQLAAEALSDRTLLGDLSQALQDLDTQKRHHLLQQVFPLN